jgi:hypothetical protein
MNYLEQIKDFFDRNIGKPIMIYNGHLVGGYADYAGDETVQLTSINNGELLVKVKESEHLTVFEKKRLYKVDIERDRIRITYSGYEDKYVEFKTRPLYR